MINKTGFVYAIKNNINNIVYIGSTFKQVEERWKEHKRRLKNNTHTNAGLQKDWNKYGEESFSFYILRDEIKGREEETLEIVNHLPNCYNTDAPTTLTRYVKKPSSLFTFRNPRLEIK